MPRKKKPERIPDGVKIFIKKKNDYMRNYKGKIETFQDAHTALVTINAYVYDKKTREQWEEVGVFIKD